MEVKIFKTCLVVFVICGCIEGKSKELDENELNDILKKQGGLKYTKLPENMYKYGDAPVVAVVRSNPLNIRRDIHHMDPIKTVKRVVVPVCPLPLLKAQIATPVLSAKLKMGAPLKNMQGTHHETPFIEDGENHECSHKHEAGKKDKIVKTAENKDNKNVLIDNRVMYKVPQNNSLPNSNPEDDKNSPTLNPNHKTIFYEEPIAKLKQSLPNNIIQNEALNKITLPIQHVSLDTLSNKPDNAYNISSAINNNNVTEALNKTDANKTSNNSLPINRVQTDIIIPINNTKPEICDDNSSTVQDEAKVPASLVCSETIKKLKLPAQPDMEPQSTNINKQINVVLNDIIPDENGNACNTKSNMASNLVNTNTIQQGNNGPCQEDNSVEDDTKYIVIDNQDVNEVIEAYKYPYNTGYNYNGFTNQGGEYNTYYPGNGYSQNQGFMQESRNNIPTPYYTAYEPTVYQYGQRNTETQQIYPNVHKPDYTLVPPPFQYPTEGQLNYNNIYTASNHGNKLNEYNTYPLNKDYTNYFKTPENNPWCQQDTMNIPDIYNAYGCRIPQNWKYRQAFYPNRFVDRILRSWRRTSITLKPDKNNAKPCLMRLKQEGQNINKTPLSTFNASLIDRNGCYRNQNTLA